MAARAGARVYVDGMKEPLNIVEAMRLPEWRQWAGAIHKEVSKLVAAGIWEEIPRTDVAEGRKVVKSHFVFKIKVKDDGGGRLVLDKVKARLVFGGHLSMEGLDFHETAAYTASAKSVRTILALGARRGYKVVSWDISQAFCFSKIEEGKEIYMELPPQVGENGAHCPELYPDCGTGKSTQVVAKLNHYLYGQKDAARAWMASVMAFFDSIGAVPLVSDRMAFRWEHDGEEMNVAVHVDDFVATPSSESIRALFHQKLMDYFGADRVTGGDETSYVLGMRIDRDLEKQTLTLTQGAFVRSMLERFQIEKTVRPVLTPLPSGTRLGKWDGMAIPTSQFDYLGFVGCLQWLVMSTRPDLAHSASLLGRFSSNPGPDHVHAALHVLRYLAGCPDLGITYHGSDEVLMADGYDLRDKLVASVDADLGGCVETDKSTTGIVVFINCGPVSWKSRKQGTNSTATLEAEMKAAALMGMELVWLRDLVTEFGVMQGCVRVMEDNSGCIALAHGQKDTAKSNHFKRTQAYVESLVGRGVMWLDDVPGAYNPADIFTKAPSSSLTGQKFCELRDITMGVTPKLYISAGLGERMMQSSDNANLLLERMRNWQDENE